MAKKNEKPVFTHEGELHAGYDVVAFREKKGGRYHVTIDKSKMLKKLKGDYPMVVLSRDLLEYVGVSPYSIDWKKDSVIDEFEKKGLIWVHGEELKSVRSAFDFFCFGEEDPMYRDEVFEHLMQNDDFVSFCEECHRRRKGMIGVGMEEFPYPKNSDCECSWTEQSRCLLLWSLRHQEDLVRLMEPSFYPVPKRTKKK